MRYREIIETTDSLASALDSLNEYIVHNEEIDQRAVAKILHANGYQEPSHGNTYYRAIFTRVDPNDQGDLRSLVDRLKANPALRLGGAEGFCDTVEGAIKFITGTIHATKYNGQSWPNHQPDTDVQSLIEYWVVYEVVASPDSVLWSMRGLRNFARTVGSRYEVVIRDMLSDYGYDDEIVLDTSQARIVDVHLYDSGDDEEEYNFSG